MRILMISASLLLSLTLAHTSVMAQDKIDEFELFRSKLNKSKAPSRFAAEPNAGPGTPSPDDEDVVTLRNAAFGSAPQTPEELQVMMEMEQQEAERKMMDAIRKGAYEPKSLDDPFKDMTNVDSVITAVTVFTNKAKVTRKAEVNIVKGAQVLVFKTMSAHMVPQSLRASGSSNDAVVKIGSIMKKNLQVPPSVDVRERASFDNIDKLKAEAVKISAERRSYEIQRDFLEKLGERAFKESDDKKAPEIKPEEWVKAAHAYRNGMAEVLEKLAEIDARKEQIAVETARTESALRRTYASKTMMDVVVIPVESDADGKMTIELSYDIGNVTWKPSYDARFTSADGKLEIMQYGTVNQGTGEEWKDVELTLSTAQPQKRAAKIAPLRPFWIDAIEPQPVAIGRPQDDQLSIPPAAKPEAADPLQEWRAKAEARRLSLENESAPPEEENAAPEVVPMVTPLRPQPRFGEARPVDIVEANIETGGFVSEYKIPGKTTIMPDGSETKLALGTSKAETKMQVQIFPQHGAEAHLMFHTKLAGDSPLWPGRMNLFRDGAYSGSLDLPLLLPGDEHDIYFGLDEQVKVKRRTLRDEKHEEGLISKDSLIAREYVTEVQNLHDTPLEIIVKETTPVSKTEKVTVDLRDDFTTKGYKKDDDNIRGALKWEMTLQPKEKKELKLGWTVNWPKDHKLLGL